MGIKLGPVPQTESTADLQSLKINFGKAVIFATCFVQKWYWIFLDFFYLYLFCTYKTYTYFIDLSQNHVVWNAMLCFFINLLIRNTLLTGFSYFILTNWAKTNRNAEEMGKRKTKPKIQQDACQGISDYKDTY